MVLSGFGAASFVTAESNLVLFKAVFDCEAGLVSG